MAVRLSTTAFEGSTYIVTAAFTDEDGDPVVPQTVGWTLDDEDGNEINTGTETPAASVEIVLSGTDLTAGGHENSKAYITVTATYNSDLGTGLPIVAQAEILVEGGLP